MGVDDISYISPAVDICFTFTGQEISSIKRKGNRVSRKVRGNPLEQIYYYPKQLRKGLQSASQLEPMMEEGSFGEGVEVLLLKVSC